MDKKFVLDQTRPGIGIYGYDANGNNIILNKKNLNFPAILKVPVIQLRIAKKEIKFLWKNGKLDRNSKLATIGIGMLMVF